MVGGCESPGRLQVRRCVAANTLLLLPTHVGSCSEWVMQSCASQVHTPLQRTHQVPGLGQVCKALEEITCQWGGGGREKNVNKIPPTQVVMGV